MLGIRIGLLIAVLFALVSEAPAQAPLVLNTTLRSFTPVTSSNWVADCCTFTDSIGRDFALICRGNSGLDCYEITNPVAPVFASHINATGSDLKDVKYMSNPPTAFALQQGSETQVVSLANPYNMQVISTISGGAHNGFVYENGATKLYLQGRNGASPYNLRVYDVSNPASPITRDTWQPPSSSQTHDVYAQDGIAYVNCLFGSGEGTYQIDISNPSNINQVGPVIPSGGLSHSCWMYNPPGGSSKYLIECNETAGGHAKIYDVSNVNNPVLASEYYSPTGASISVHNPVVMDKYCFIAWYADYVRILDMSRPSNPVIAGIYDPWPTNAGASVYDGCWGVWPLKAIPGGYRLVATESFSSNRGFYVIDFTPPEAPSIALSTNGFGDVTFSVSGAIPGSVIYNGTSSQTSGLLGDGPVGGIGADALFSLGTTAQPYVATTNFAGNYSFSLPNGAVPIGLSFDVINFSQTPTNGWQPSQCGRITF
ncbi:MAG: hypothetical protein HRU14_05380 [Planctomycetes bacterium]|nr:hypothetical protein [Planctomycetota bacterium]